jgi:hypothetical protein
MDRYHRDNFCCTTQKNEGIKVTKVLPDALGSLRYCIFPPRIWCNKVLESTGCKLLNDKEDLDRSKARVSVCLCLC